MVAEASKLKATASDAEFTQQVGIKAERKLKAKTKSPDSVLSGLGVMGLIGWSVAVPTLLGAFIGHWLDRHYPSSHSWTLALIVAGLCLGCWHAWRWMSKENQGIIDEYESKL